MTAADVIGKLTAPLKRKIQAMMARALVTAVTDTGFLQRVQVKGFAGQERDAIEKFQSYGFTSNPQDGAEGLLLALGGDPAHSVLILVDDGRYRLKGLARGEVAAYTDEGAYFWFKRSMKIECRSNTFKFQGASHELMDQLVQLADQVDSIANFLSTTTTNTMFGPMKLNNFADFATIKTAVDGIVTALTGLKGS